MCNFYLYDYHLEKIRKRKDGDLKYFICLGRETGYSLEFTFV